MLSHDLAPPPDQGPWVMIGSRVRLRLGSATLTPSPLQECLLLLLAHAGGGGMRRDAIIWLLWQDDETRRSRHRLRQLAHLLNRRTDHELVALEGNRVRLAPGVGVRWGDPEVGEDLTPPTPAFREELDVVNRTLRSRRARSEAREVDRARLADDPDRVLALLRDRDDADEDWPWQEAVWALIRSGRIREAELDLREVLGREPADRLMAALDRARGEADTLLRLASVPAGTPLLGREDATRELYRSLVEEHRLLLITGARGVGRSRMLASALAFLVSHTEDVVILSARGGRSGSEEFFDGIRQVLTDDLVSQAFLELDQPHSEVLSRALPLRFPSRGPHVLAEIGGPASYLRIANAMVELLRRAFGPTDFLVAVDDLDQLDRSSLEVLTLLSRKPGFRMLATWSTDSTAGAQQLLARFEDHRPAIVALTDLDPASSRRLARALGSRLDPDKIDELAQISGGRPKRLVELIQSHLADPSGGRSGRTTHEIIRLRLRELEDEEQDLLLHLAILGRPCPVGLLHQIVGGPVLAFNGHLQALESRSFVQREGDEVSFGPDLVKDFLLAELPDSMRESMHSRIAEAMLKAERPDPAIVGRQLFRAGRQSEARPWLLDAGRAAADRTAYAEAIELLEASTRVAQADTGRELSQLGDLYAGMGDFPNAMQAYERAGVEFEGAGDRGSVIAVTLKGVGAMLRAGEDYSSLTPRVSDLYEQAIDAEDTDLIAWCLETAFEVGEYAHAALYVENVHRELTAVLESRPLTFSLAYVGGRLTYLGEPELGLRLARIAYSRARKGQGNQALALKRLLAGMATQGRASGQRWTILSHEAERIANGRGDLLGRVELLTLSGHAAMARRDWEVARKPFLRAADLIGYPNPSVDQFISINLAEIAVRQGDWAGAARNLEIVEKTLPSPRKDLVALYNAARILESLESGQISKAKEYDAAIGAFDLEFPYTSDLSLVVEAKSALLRRLGNIGGAIMMLKTALSVMPRHIRSTRAHLASRLASIERSS